jgi:hypothetical protein
LRKTFSGVPSTRHERGLAHSFMFCSIEKIEMAFPPRPWESLETDPGSASLKFLCSFCMARFYTVSRRTIFANRKW